MLSLAQRREQLESHLEKFREIANQKNKEKVNQRILSPHTFIWKFRFRDGVVIFLLSFHLRFYYLKLQTP